MKIKSSSSIRNSYREIADECIETGEPVFLTNNGEGELVVMSIDSYNSLHMDLKIQAAIMEADRKELSGETNYVSLSEAKERVLNAVGIINGKI